MRDRRATPTRRARNVGMLAPQRANRDPRLRHFPDPACLSSDLPAAASKCKYCGTEHPAVA